jgi:hypothetical protein
MRSGPGSFGSEVLIADRNNLLAWELLVQSDQISSEPF